jgi:hypothetical protein
VKAARGLASAAKPGRADLNTENRIIHSEYNVLTTLVYATLFGLV